MKTHHFAAPAPGGSVFICVGAGADTDRCVDEVFGADTPLVPATADSPSDCFFRDSLMERRNSSISTFGRTNCFGAEGAVGVTDSGVATDDASTFGFEDAGVGITKTFSVREDASVRAFDEGVGVPVAGAVLRGATRGCCIGVDDKGTGAAVCGVEEDGADDRGGM